MIWSVWVSSGEDARRRAIHLSPSIAPSLPCSVRGRGPLSAATVDAVSTNTSLTTSLAPPWPTLPLQQADALAMNVYLGWRDRVAALGWRQCPVRAYLVVAPVERFERLPRLAGVSHAPPSPHVDLDRPKRTPEDVTGHRNRKGNHAQRHAESAGVAEDQLCPSVGIRCRPSPGSLDSPGAQGEG